MAVCFEALHLMLGIVLCDVRLRFQHRNPFHEVMEWVAYGMLKYIYIRGWSHLEQEARYTMDILLVNLFKFCSNKAILMFSYICNSMTYNIMCCCTLPSGHSKWEVTCFCYSHIRRQGARHPSDYRKCLNSTNPILQYTLRSAKGPIIAYYS